MRYSSPPIKLEEEENMSHLEDLVIMDEPVRTTRAPAVRSNGVALIKPEEMDVGHSEDLVIIDEPPRTTRAPRRRRSKAPASIKSEEDVVIMVEPPRRARAPTTRSSMVALRKAEEEGMAVDPSPSEDVVVLEESVRTTRAPTTRSSMAALSKSAEEGMAVDPGPSEDVVVLEESVRTTRAPTTRSSMAGSAAIHSKLSPVAPVNLDSNRASPSSPSGFPVPKNPRTVVQVLVINNRSATMKIYKAWKSRRKSRPKCLSQAPVPIQEPTVITIESSSDDEECLPVRRPKPVQLIRRKRRGRPPKRTLTGSREISRLGDEEEHRTGVAAARPRREVDIRLRSRPKRADITLEPRKEEEGPPSEELQTVAGDSGVSFSVDWQSYRIPKLKYEGSKADFRGFGEKVDGPTRSETWARNNKDDEDTKSFLPKLKIRADGRNWYTAYSKPFFSRSMMSRDGSAYGSPSSRDCRTSVQIREEENKRLLRAGRILLNNHRKVKGIIYLPPEYAPLSPNHESLSVLPSIEQRTSVWIAKIEGEAQLAVKGTSASTLETATEAMSLLLGVKCRLELEEERDGNEVFGTTVDTDEGSRRRDRVPGGRSWRSWRPRCEAAPRSTTSRSERKWDASDWDDHRSSTIDRRRSRSPAAKSEQKYDGSWSSHRSTMLDRGRPRSPPPRSWRRFDHDWEDSRRGPVDQYGSRFSPHRSERKFDLAWEDSRGGPVGPGRGHSPPSGIWRRLDHDREDGRRRPADQYRPRLPPHRSERRFDHYGEDSGRDLVDQERRGSRPAGNQPVFDDDFGSYRRGLVDGDRSRSSPYRSWRRLDDRRVSYSSDSESRRRPSPPPRRRRRSLSRSPSRSSSPWPSPAQRPVSPSRDSLERRRPIGPSSHPYSGYGAVPNESVASIKRHGGLWKAGGHGPYHFQDIDVVQVDSESDPGDHGIKLEDVQT